MKKLLLVLFLALSLIVEVNAQENKASLLYIQRGTFTEIINVDNISYPADDFINVNVFYEMGEKAPFGVHSIKCILKRNLNVLLIFKN